MTDGDKYVKELFVDLKSNVIKEFKDSVSEIGKDFAKQFTTGITSVFSGIAKDFSSTITDSFKNGIKELQDMLDYSKLSNATTRDLAFSYGFSSSEAYGYSKAMDMLGFNSEEDLFYANQQEMQQFREAFEKYSDYYTKLYDDGFFAKMQEYQFEMQDFKQEMSLQVASFFMDNKELIKSGLTAMLKISEVVLKIASYLLGTSSYQAATVADVISQYNQTTNKNINTNINNTFNGVAKSDETYFANAGTMTYQQVLKALGGA